MISGIVSTIFIRLTCLLRGLRVNQTPLWIEPRMSLCNGQKAYYTAGIIVTGYPITLATLYLIVSAHALLFTIHIQ